MQAHIETLRNLSRENQMQDVIHRTTFPQKSKTLKKRKKEK